VRRTPLAAVVIHPRFRLEPVHRYGVPVEGAINALGGDQWEVRMRDRLGLRSTSALGDRSGRVILATAAARGEQEDCGHARGQGSRPPEPE